MMIPTSSSLLAFISICYVGRRSQALFSTIVHHQEHFVFIEEVIIDELGDVG